MVLTRLRCVVTLTILTLLTLCKTAQVAARGSGAKEPQAHGFDSLPRANRLRLRRRWPARLLALEPTIPIIKALTHTPSIKTLIPPETIMEPVTNEEQIVIDLFNFYEVKDAKVLNFFKSQQFKDWEKEVKGAYKDYYEELMFSAMYNKLRLNDNGGVEAVIAQALKDKDTRYLALRFEDLLLQRLANGIEEGNYDDISMYIRYLLYCGPEHWLVHYKMDLEMGPNSRGPHSLASWFQSLEAFLRKDTENDFMYLEKYFMVISGDRKVANVFKKLRSVEGFNNNAFLLEKLYEMAMELESNVDFVKFMLSTLRKAKWTNNDISEKLLELKDQEISSELDPIIKSMAESLASGQA